MVLGNVARCIRTSLLVACVILLGFSPLDLWIRKTAFEVTCHIQSHSSNGWQMDWELACQVAHGITAK